MTVAARTGGPRRVRSTSSRGTGRTSCSSRSRRGASMRMGTPEEAVSADQAAQARPARARVPRGDATRDRAWSASTSCRCACSARTARCCGTTAAPSPSRVRLRCRRSWRRPRSSASRPCPSRCRPTSAAGCRPSPSSGSATRPCWRRANACARRSAPRGSDFPDGRVTVNLAPAPLRKHGTGFDLPIAVALLVATRQVPRARSPRATRWSASSRSTARCDRSRGMLAHALAAVAARPGAPRPGRLRRASSAGCRTSSTPACDRLGDARARRLVAARRRPSEVRRGDRRRRTSRRSSGTTSAKRALEVAAAGGHNLLLVGPPGSGKTMLARRLPGILPAAHARGAARDGARALGRRARHGTGARGRPAVPRAAPQLLDRGARRRRHAAAARRGEPRAQRRAVPRRVRRVRARAPCRRCDSRWRTAASRSFEPRRASPIPPRSSLVAAMNPCPCGYIGDTAESCTCRTRSSTATARGSAGR